MKLGRAIAHVHDATTDLRDDLAAISERHAADHDVYHQGRRMAGRCDGLAEMLAPFLERYGEDTGDGEHAEAWQSFAERVRRGLSTMTGRSPKGGPLLLHDLRELEIEAHACVTDWVITRQGAMAARDKDLVDLCALGMDEMRRVEKWLTTRIKESAPQILMSAD